MSIAALNWAFALPVRGLAQKAVLIALADHADADGECYPAMARLALMTGACERAVRNALRWLEAQELIATQTKEGGVSRYRLALDRAYTPAPDAPPVKSAPRHDVPPPPALDAAPPGTWCPPTPAPDAPEPSKEVSKKDSVATLLAQGAAEAPDIRLEMWSEGLEIVRGLTGKPSGPARAIVGKLAQACLDDCALALSILREARDLRPVGDPVAWLMAAAKGRGADAPFKNGFLEMIRREGMPSLEAEHENPFFRLPSVH